MAGTAPFVGRDRELGELLAAVDRAAGGQGSLVVVAGEPGAGKTRLLHEVADRAAGAVLWGTASEASSGIPFLPLAEAINRFLDSAPEALELGPSSSLLGVLAPRLAGAEIPVKLDPELRPALFEALLELLATAGRGRASVLIVDDAQWADASSLDLLEYASRRARSLPVLVLLGWRDAPGIAPPARFERAGETLRLRPLAPGAIELVVDAQTRLAPEVRARIVEVSRGNPFAAEQLAGAGAAGSLPPTVRAAILGHAAQLSAEEREVAEAAAVVGTVVRVEVVAAVRGLDPAVARAALDRLVADRILDDEPNPGAYRFHHELIRDALYERVPGPARRALHGAAAVELERRAGPPSEIAEHLERAGRDAESARFWASAAAAAESVGGYAEAGDLYSRAASTCAEPAERARLACQAGYALMGCGNTERARQSLEAGIRGLEAVGEAPGLQRTYLALTYNGLQREAESLAEHERAIAELSARGPSPDLARAEALLGAELFVMFRPHEAIEHARRAMAIAEQVGDRRHLLLAEGVIGFALMHLDRPDEAIEILDRVNPHALELHEYQPLAAGLNNVCVIRLHCLRGREALEILEPYGATPLAQTPYALVRARATLLRFLGRPAEALEEVEEGLRWAARLEDGLLRRGLTWLRVALLADLDRVDEVRAQLATVPEARAASEAMGRVWAVIAAALAAGDPGRAVAEARAFQLPRAGFYASRFCSGPVVEALVAGGHRDEAAAVAARLAPSAIPGDAYWQLIQARLDGSPLSAAALAETAADRLGEAGYLSDECSGRRLAATALVAAERTEEAARQLRQSLATAKRAGLAREARLAREMLGSLGLASDVLTADAIRRRLEELDRVAPALRDGLIAAIDALTRGGGREREAGLVLRDYYVKRVGSQEVVAARHYLTRPTFYRRLHLGWELLAARLGPLDEVPAGSAES